MQPTGVFPVSRKTGQFLFTGVFLVGTSLGLTRQTTALTPEEAQAIAVDAYVYGYPLVTMELTRRVMTNVEKPEGTHAPMGQFVHLREYPTAAFKEVTAPNADTLYSLAWLDVSQEPYVLSIPNAKGRYYLMPLLDGWTNVFQVPGKRTTGTEAQKYAVTGPGWKGSLPQGIKEYKSPTNMVWILGRTYCTGTPEDYQEVHAFQDQLSLVPLNVYDKPYTPPVGKADSSIDMKTPVREQVNKLDAGAYFKLLTTLMKANPPTAEDAPLVAQMAKLGMIPGQNFEINKLDPLVAKAVLEAPKIGLEKITAYFKKGDNVNGWTFTTHTGIYGTDYLNRALIAAVGLGANRPQDAVYPVSDMDATSQPYSGANRYVIQFKNKNELPPVNAFWSLTMYDDHFFFVDNPLNRYTISSRSELKYNKDGSLSLFLQKDSPGKNLEANWLPAPEGRFILMLRLYWPKDKAPSILDGTWKLPTVKLIKPVFDE